MSIYCLKLSEFKTNLLFALKQEFKHNIFVKLIKNQLLRTLVFVAGCTSVVVGVIGIFVPLLPTTPFILLAAWCFVRSSEKAHQWIYSHPAFGKALTDWEKNRSIAPGTKALAVSTILLSVVFIWVKVNNEWVKYSVTVFLAGVSLFILTRKSHPDSH
jgi:uncharacterized membrane protein YbaN (DUF454 family)